MQIFLQIYLRDSPNTISHHSLAISDGKTFVETPLHVHRFRWRFPKLFPNSEATVEARLQWDRDFLLWLGNATVDPDLSLSLSV